MQYNKYEKVCKFGSNCKYGVSCRFYHPFNNSYKESSYVNDQQYPISNTNVSDLELQMNCMNLCNPSNQQTQSNIFKKHPNKHNKQKLSKNQRHKNESSSESNSDEQSNSDQQNQNKKRSYINPDQKFQEIQSLKGEDKIKLKKKRKFYEIFQQTPFDPVAYQLYSQALFEFFEKRHIKEHKRQKIGFFLAKQLTFQPQTVQYIIFLVEHLEMQGYVQHFCYKRLIKTICKQNFIIQNIKEKLSKKINVDQKRRNKHNDLIQRFPNPANVEFLESSDLIQNEINKKQVIYLIDGNNCLTTQKHLRHFFRKQDAMSKAQAQIRFRWLISLTISDPKRCFIFFDDKFGDEIYEKLYDEMMTGKDYKAMISSSTVIYAEKDQEADECIRQKMKQLTQNDSINKKEFVLVTGDRVLVQQCYQIHPIKRSSGSYLIKFVRKTVKLIQKQRPQVKKRMKKILSYQ